jgi:tetratricopeptide (TPR) repeat protein
LDGIQETDIPATARSSTAVDDPLLTSEEYQRRLQLLLQDLDRARTNAAQIEQKLDADGTKTLSQMPTREPSGQLPPMNVMQDAVRLSADKPGEVVQDIAAESTGLRLYNPSSRSEGNLFTPTAQPAEIRASVMSPRVDAAGPASLEATLQRISEYTNRLQAASGDRSAAQSVAEPALNPAEAASPSQTPEPKPPQTNENPDPALRREFDQVLAAASLGMRQGRFDRAAESFTLACVYLPRDPRAHLGKSHALLALGQYAASEASLAKAVEFDAQVALKKVNLVETIGGPDLFVERITKLEELAQAGDGSLQFLLAYIYYQMDRPNEARTAVGAARSGEVSPVAVSQLAAGIGR